MVKGKWSFLGLAIFNAGMAVLVLGIIPPLALVNAATAGAMFVMFAKA